MAARKKQFKTGKNPEECERREQFIETVEYFSARSDLALALGECLDGDSFELQLESLPTHPVHIRVTTRDSLTVARAYVQLVDLNPLVVCQVTELVPGANARAGALTHDAEFARRSSLFLTLPRKAFPLRGTQCIYSAGVSFTPVSDYPSDELFTASVCSMAALDKPKLDDGDYLHRVQAEMAEEALEAQFQLALVKGHDSIILNDFGCSVGHPPAGVARILASLLERYKTYFKRICITVHEDNHDVFAETIGEPEQASEPTGTSP